MPGAPSPSSTLTSDPVPPRSPGAWSVLLRPHATQALLVAAALTDAVFPAIVTSLDTTASGLDPWRHTLSRHAQVPGFPWMEAAFVAHGVAMGLLAVALWRLPPRPWAAPAALWISAAASLLLALFAADEGKAETLRGHLHQSFAPVAFLGVAAAGLLSWWTQRASPAWQGLARVPGVFAWLLAVFLSLFGLLLAVVQVTDGPRIVLGAMERLVIVGIAGWVLAEAVQGFRVAERTRGGTPDGRRDD